MERLGGFVPEMARACAGLLIWVGQLAALYAVTSVACARRTDAFAIGGMSMVRVAIVVLTTASLLAAAVVLWRAVRDVRALPPPHSDLVSDERRFFDWMSALLAAFALAAIVWTNLPALMVPACDGTSRDGPAMRSDA